jgi:hypothetical protein
LGIAAVPREAHPLNKFHPLNKIDPLGGEISNQAKEQRETSMDNQGWQLCDTPLSF